MGKSLTAEQIAKACELRGQRMSWNAIAPIVGAHSTKIRNALVNGLGYAPSLKPGNDCNGDQMQEARDLYMDETIKPPWSLRRLGKRYGVSKPAVKRWIIKYGGTIRVQGGRRGERALIAAQTGPGQTNWRHTAACSIGHKVAGTFADGGALYCANECDWTNCQSPEPCEHLGGNPRVCTRTVTPDDPEGPCRFEISICEQEATAENIAGLAKFQALQAEQERKVVADHGRERMQLAQDSDRQWMIREMERRQR